MNKREVSNIDRLIKEKMGNGPDTILLPDFGDTDGVLSRVNDPQATAEAMRKLTRAALFSEVAVPKSE